MMSIYWGSRSSGSWHGHLGLILLLLLFSHSVAQWCLILCNPMVCRCQASLSLSLSQRLLKLMSIESTIPPNHLILCHPLLLLPSVFPSIRDFSNELVLQIRWPKYWSFSISPSNDYTSKDGLCAWYHHCIDPGNIWHWTYMAYVQYVHEVGRPRKLTFLESSYFHLGR